MAASEQLMHVLDWAYRPAAWSFITSRNNLFRALREAVEKDSVGEVARAFESFLADTSVKHPSDETIAVARTLIICARIAALRPDTAAKLTELLDAIGPAKDKRVPTAMAILTATLDWNDRWLPFVRDQLHNRQWPAGLSAAWGWDAVLKLSGQPLTTEQPVNLSCLLIVQDHGVIGELTLERFPDRAAATLYPDPEFMWHVTWDKPAQVPNDEEKTFEESLQNAHTAVKDLLGAIPPGAIRWRIKRRDGKPLHRIEGGSAGAAFALGLAKFLASDTVRNAESPPDIVAALDDIDLDGIAATGWVAGDGIFNPVESVYEKLRSARHSTVVKIHTAIIAEAQKCDIGASEQEVLIPNSEFYVICTDSLTDAINKLHEEYGPRATIRRYELDVCKKLKILGIAEPPPIEMHYRVLPLLRQIMSDEPHHEEVLEELVEMEPLFHNFRSIAKDASTSVPRFIVIGNPGSGKTSMQQYLCWKAAAGELQIIGRQLIPVRIKLAVWEHWAKTNAKYNLAPFLASYYDTDEVRKKFRRLPTPQHWKRWLERGEVLLLLDGLDEIAGDPSFVRNAVAFNDCPAVFTCRTISFEQDRELFPDLPVFALSGLDDTQRDSFVVSYPGRRFDANKIITQLNRTPSMQTLGRNPLLLSLMCFAANEGEGDLPPTRGELYERAVDNLLERSAGIAADYPRKVPLSRKRMMLEQAALSLFGSTGARRKLTFEEEEILDAFTQAAAKVPYGNESGSIADALLVDLTDNSGILKRAPEGGYSFLHDSILEYLVASVLAKHVNKRGWSGDIEIKGKHCAVEYVIDKKVWDPNWQEVIVLFAGQLTDPSPLLIVLADEKKDDFFRHRLTVAALCLPEIQPKVRKICTKIIKKITLRWFRFWWQYTLTYYHLGYYFQYQIGSFFRRQEERVPSAARHLTPALVSLVQVDEWVLDRLLRHLCSADGHARTRAAEALGELGHAVPPACFNRLLELLHNDKEHTRLAAADAIGRIGPAAATPEVLAVLTHWFRTGEATGVPFRETGVRDKAIDVLRWIGPAAATQGLLKVLMDLLDEGDEREEDEAAKLLGELAPASATQEVLDHLLELLIWRREAAAQALAGMGFSAAREDIVTVLQGFLEGDIRERVLAATVLTEMGPPESTTENLIKVLFQFLSHDRVRVDPFNSWFRCLGQVARRYGVLEGLVKLLSDERDHVRKSAATALGKVGPAAATDIVVKALVQCAADDKMRFSVLWALGSMGPSAAHHPDVLSVLVRSLADNNQAVRSEAARALGLMGPAVAAHQQVLKALIRCVDDPETQSEALRALGQIGTVVADHSDALAVFVRCLEAHHDVKLREAAARAVGKLGAKAGTNRTVLERLVECLTNENHDLGTSAAEALENLGARIFDVRDMSPQVQHIESLSKIS